MLKNTNRSSRSNQHNAAPRRRYASRLALIAGVVFVTAACSSPEQRIEKYHNSGQEFLEAGDLGRANVQFQNVLKIDEQHVPTLVAMSAIAEQRQDLKRLFGLSQRIVRIDPGNLGAHIKLGQLYLIGSDETAALEQADTALAIDPDYIDALALKSGVLLKLGDTAGALELARRVISVDPANAEATTVVATSFALKEDYESALAELNRALDVNPKIAVLQLLRIQLLSKMERTDDVRHRLGQLVELFPEEPVYRRAYSVELLRREQYGEAQQQLETVVALIPDSLDAKLDVIRVLNEKDGIDAAGRKLRDYVDAQPKNNDLKFALAGFYRQNKAWEDATAVLQPLTKSKNDTDAARAKNDLATLAALQGNRDAAIALINEVLSDDENNTDALIKRAGIQIENKELDEAVSNLRVVLGNDPDSSRAMLLMSAALEQQGEVDLARAQLTNAFDKSRKQTGVATYFAKFLIRHGNVVRAEDVLEQSLTGSSRDLDNLKLLAAIRLDQQDWQGAEEVAAIIEGLKDNSEGGAVQNIRTLALTGLGDYDRLIDTLSARNEEQPLESRPLATLVGAYLREGRGEEAKALLTKINESDPANYAAYILLSQVHSQGGDNAAAEAVLINATNADQSRPEAYELLYRFYIRSRQREKAVELIDAGLAATPGSAALRFFKADILLASGALEGALEIYSALIDERPEDKIVANNFVSLSSDLRLDSASIARALKIASLIEDETNPNFRDTVGWAYFRAGKIDQAITHLSEAAEAAGDNADILYHLGAAQIAAGEIEEGKQQLEKALQLGGGNFRFKSEVQRLLADG